MKDLEYPPTFPLKEWLTLDRAAKHLSAVFQEEVTEADILRFARQKHLTLSVCFPNLTKAKSGQIVRYPRRDLEASLAKSNLPAELEWALLSPEEARSLPDLPERAEGEPVLVIRILKIDADHYVKFTGPVRTVGGVLDLPMIGGEQLDIENEFQRRMNGQAIIWSALEGVIVQATDGRFCQLQEQYNVKEYSSIWDTQQRELKQHIIDGDLEQEEGECLINQHKAVRKQMLQMIKALPDSELYYPARRLPKDSNLIVRRDALLEFEKLVNDSKFGSNFSAPDRSYKPGESACEAVSAGQIMHRFKVKLDPDANGEWWKNMMRNASDNGLTVCRVGEGRKGPGGSIWRPDLIAAWLVGRHERGFDGLDVKAAGTALRKFPGCEPAADDFFSPAE